MKQCLVEDKEESVLVLFLRGSSYRVSIIYMIVINRLKFLTTSLQTFHKTAKHGKGK